MGRQAHRLQRFHLARLGNPGRHQADGFLSGFFGFIVMHPTGLLAQADVIIQVGVQPGAFQCAAERLFMQENGAGADDHAVDAFLLNIVNDLLLSGIGAHEHVRARNNDTGPFLQHARYHLTFHHIANVAAALTNIHAHARLILFGILRLCVDNFLRHIPRSSRADAPPLSRTRCRFPDKRRPRPPLRQPS